MNFMMDAHVNIGCTLCSVRFWSGINQLFAVAMYRCGGGGPAYPAPVSIFPADGLISLEGIV